MLRNLNIGTRLGIGFGLIFMLLIFLTLFGLNRMEFLSDHTTMMYNHPLTVSNAVLRVNTNIVKMHRHMKDVALARNASEIYEASATVDEYEKEVYRDFEIIGERFLGEKVLREEALAIFASWKSIRDEVITLMLAGKRVEAANITKGKGAEHVVKIENAMESLGNFAQNKAAEFLEVTVAARDSAFRTMYVLVLLVIMAGVVFAVYLTRGITRPVAALQSATVMVGSGNLDAIITVDSQDEIGQLAEAFGEMTVNLREITASRNDLNKEIAERKRAEGMLRQLNEELESRVEQRTQDLKRAHEQLIIKEKLAAIGQLSSTVGHEIRNPLGVIGNSVFYLTMKLQDSDLKVRRHLVILDREVKRSNKIISDLLDFSGAREPSMESADLNRVVQEAIDGVEKQNNITIEIELAKELPELFFDKDQLHQVILNLVLNAVHAMPDGGNIAVSTELKGEVVELAVKDTGSGIPLEDLDKIFEPLFSTKAKGAGLGLAIVKGIIDRHMGKVVVESKVGEGSTFTASLPFQRKKI